MSKYRPWWIIALIFIVSFTIISGLIYLVIRLTKEQTRPTKKNTLISSSNNIPSPSTWDYEAYVNTLPKTGVIKDNVIPDVLTRFMKNTTTTRVTSTFPPVSDQEQDTARRQNMTLIASIKHLGLKWGVITVDSISGPIIFKDIRGQQQDSGNVFELSPWNWADPKPENGIVNRHAGGLDPVDWKTFSKNCQLFVISRGVTMDLHVRYEQLHAIRTAFNYPIVLVLDSALAIEVINQLLVSTQPTERLCFLIHSTC